MDIRSRALACRRALLASLCLASTTKNNISEDFREDAVDAWRGWRAPRRGTVKRGCTGASITFSTTHTTPSNDRSALPVRLRALSVPSDRNRSPRGASAGQVSWRERLGRGGGGARAVGRDPSGHQRSVGAIDEPRSARPMDTSSTSRGRCGGGEGHGWGGHGSTCGGFVRVWCTQSEDVIPFDVPDHRLWPSDPRAAQDLG